MLQTKWDNCEYAEFTVNTYIPVLYDKRRTKNKSTNANADAQKFAATHKNHIHLSFWARTPFLLSTLVHNLNTDLDLVFRQLLPIQRVRWMSHDFYRSENTTKTNLSISWTLFLYFFFGEDERRREICNNFQNEWDGGHSDRKTNCPKQSFMK